MRTVAVASIGLAAGFTWLSLRTASIPTSSPNRLVAELRLAQFSALLLVLTAGAYIGAAVSHENQLGVGLDVAISIGFLVAAGTTLVRDPEQALTILALSFAGHAIFAIAHRPGLLPEDVVPRWYMIGCAIYDVYIGALCYWPILRR